MFIDDFPPSFKYENHRTIFNYAVKNILADVLSQNKDKLIDEKGVKILKFDSKSYIVYTNSSLTDDIFDRDNKLSDLISYNMMVGYSLKNSGIYAMLDGCNALELAQDLSKHTGISVDVIMNTYKENIMKLDDEYKIEDGNTLALLIPKLYQLAKDTSQVKSDENYRSLKGYCDDDFNIYTYHDKFMISCSASANMYFIDFKENGFVIYGHSNSYGKEMEEELNPEFEWDTAEYEPYYFKYLNEHMIIMEVIDNEVKVQNTLVSMLCTIVDYIAEKEKLI